VRTVPHRNVFASFIGRPGLIAIQLNGETKQVPAAQTVLALLEGLKLPVDRVAVERNLQILPRDEWSQTFVEDGDRLEVVHFVGGGLAERCD
jgi:thiamine biosynthesis protein ThiS